MERRKVLAGAGIAGATGLALATLPEPASAAALDTLLRPLSSFAGATASDKLRTAISQVRGLVRKPVIILDPGTTLDAGSSPFVLPSGFALMGTPGIETEFGYSCPVNLRGTAVFAMEAGSKGQTFAGLSFQGTYNVRAFADSPQDATGNYWRYVTLRDCSFNGFDSIYHGPWLGTSWSGSCYLDNFSAAREPLYIGGSDNQIFTDGGFFEMGGTSSYATRANLPAMLRLGSMTNTVIGAIYITGSPTTPVRLEGGNGGVNLDNMVLEGRPSPGTTLWCAGELARLTSGRSHFRNREWGYAMRSPADTGHSPGGFIHVSGGDHVVDGGTYQPYPAIQYPAYTRPNGASSPSGVLPPLAWVSGGSLRITNITRGPNASTVPEVWAAASAIVNTDNSVRVVRF